MKITNGKDRTVEISENEGGVLLVERVRFVPRGFTKGRWEETRIWLSADELKKVAAFHPAFSAEPK